jgi:hypothetical protein
MTRKLFLQGNRALLRVALMPPRGSRKLCVVDKANVLEIRGLAGSGHGLEPGYRA